MVAQSLPGPFSSKPIWNYDVFLNFRGEGTHKNFTDHLYTALDQAGINTFRDDDELPRGKEIFSKPLKAIEESRISIVVFSKGYASSTWCLDQLVEIMECKNGKGQTVLPIFYGVDPSHVRHQTLTFADAFDQHENLFNVEMDRMQKWRTALTQAANLSGYDLQNVSNGYEAEFIQKFVEEVSNIVMPTCLNVAIHLIGIDSRVKVIKELLYVGASDVRIVGIYGRGGIGKTTIAKAVYNQIYSQFDGSSCLLNIKDRLKDRNGLVRLQEQLLFDILQTKGLKISNIDNGINIIKKRLCKKRVLIVLDDVDHLKQLNSLARNCIWFGSGSRVIITTRDENLLTTVGVYGKYKVEKLNHDESLQLFSWHAFNNSHPIEKYLKLSKDIVNYVDGLPLALKVLGSSCFDNDSIKEWEETLEKLQKIPNEKIQDILRISFDSLDDIVKGIFLDIACFFIDMQKEYAIKILNGCGLFPYTGMRTLIRRSLLTISCFNKLEMHNLIQDMGKEIVCGSSPNYPEERTRLWFYEDVINVLKKQTGLNEVEGLILNLPDFENVHLKTEAFAKMERLKLLQINGVYLSGCFEHLPRELRWLCWHYCPLKFLPSSFHLESLVVLDMQYSYVKQVWKGIKILNKLELLDLSNSKYLTATPNFLGVPHLERLILKGCTNLVKVHHSIGHLKKLVFLNLEGCRNLRNLPSSICYLKSLKILNLFGCNMRASRKLLVYRTAIKQLPSTFGLLKNLATLSCKGQPSIPEAYVKREDEKKKIEFVSEGGQPGTVAAAPKVIPEANVKREDAGEQPGTVAAEPEVNMPIPGVKENEIRSLHAAALNGNWRVVEVLLQKDPTLLQSDLTTAKDTALHIATRANRSAFVEKLINNLSKDDLALRTISGDTALSIAAMSGFIDIAKRMISANDELPNLINKYDLQPPLFKAVRNLHKDMAQHLFPCTNISLLKLEDRIRLFVATVISEMYDMALQMLEKDAMLAYGRDDKESKLTALCVLARKPQDIGTKSGVGTTISYISSSRKPQDIGTSKVGTTIRYISSWICGDSGEAFKPTLAYQLLEKVLEQVLKLEDDKILKLISETPRVLFEAVKSGNVEFVSLLLNSFPDLIWKVDGEALVHAIILYRQAKIFNLICEVGAFKDYVATHIDADGNNMLHLAGKLSPVEKLDTSRPNLQMQRELIWFKEMQKIMPRQFTEMKNHENLTPKDVFEREHKELIIESRTAMKETASSCMVLSIIISTIVIAFAFTVPGFSNSTVQTLIFPKDMWFMIFWVSNTVALLSSCTSIVMLLRILTSRFGGSEYITSLRANMMCGFTALFVSITSIAIAFTAAVFITCGLLV